MYDVTIPMALADYIPVALFGWAAVLLAGVLCLHRAGLREKLTDQGG